MASVKFAVRSETGNVRTNNEDNFFCNGIYMSPEEYNRPFFLNGIAEVPCIFAVFDGMGGHDCGEVASLTAAETLSEHAGKIRSGSCDEVDAFVHDADRKLIALMDKRGIRTGTTMTMAVFGKNFFTAYNLGDSRIYSVKDGYLTRINDDHTLAEEMIRAGQLNPKYAENSRYSNIITRFIGMNENELSSKPDVYALLDYEKNRRVILCTDGLNKMLTHREMNKIVMNAETVNDAVNALVDEALRKGGKDNVTCIALDLP